MHDELLNDFLEESIDLIEKVKTNLANWQYLENKVEAIDNIYRWVHTIKGGCAIFEYKETTRIAHDLETFLGSLKERVETITTSDLKKIDEGIMAIESTFNEKSGIESSSNMTVIEEVSSQNDSSYHFETQFFKDWMSGSEAVAKDLHNDGFRFFEIKLPTAICEKILAKLGEYEVFTLDTYEKDGHSFCLCSINLKSNPLFE
ncbi:MAG: Hpt domain-containing protein, partial [Bacteriovoracaceae bacterium]